MNEINELKKKLKNVDRVHYELFLVSPHIIKESARTQVRDALSQLIPKDYIWQRETIILTDADEGRLIFTGSTRFGENVEDEWFIVHLLLSVTKRFDWLCARTWDNDGQFLMIEAAMHLPDWCQSSGDQETLLTNRVFLYGGDVHLIPPPTNPGHIKFLPPSLYTEPLPNVDAGIDLVINPMIDTRAPEAVRRAILYRTESSVKNYRHRARCYLPKTVIALLRADPQLISRAVRAFVNRDNSMMKYTSSMERFMPKEHDIEYTIVTMSRCMYAQLVSQKFSPPKILASIYRDYNKNKAMELGVKIICGFEMMYHKAREKRNKGWQLYVERLRNMGYFRGEMEGSALYRELQAKAREEFEKTLQHDNAPRLDQYTDDQLSGDVSIANHASLEEDDDRWLDDAAPLTEYFEVKGKQMEGIDEKNKAEEMLTGVKQFMCGESSYEGVEMSSFDQMMQKAFGSVEMQDLFDQDDEIEEEYDDMPVDDKGQVRDMKSYMKAMDRELGRKRQYTKEEEMEDIEREQYGDEYVILKNLLESVKAQQGGTGPLSNLMKEMGINLPMDEDE